MFVTETCFLIEEQVSAFMNHIIDDYVRVLFRIVVC